MNLCLSTAVLGEDFIEPSPLQVTFFSGDVEGNVSCATFEIVDDENLEFDHEFMVILESITPNGPTVPRYCPTTTTTVFINDDEGMHYAVLTVSLLSF